MKQVREAGSSAANGESVAGTQSITRTLAVLRVLREAPRDVGISEIARALSLHTSTIHRIVRALVAAGYVVQNFETERYRLGREAFLLGRAAERNLGFDHVLPLLEQLSETTGESANLVVRDSDEGLVVLRVESSQPLRYSQPAGTRIPLYCTSTGKAMLAFSENVEQEVGALPKLNRLTSSTITSQRALRRELEEIKARGYSINQGERIAGVCGVAAPVLGIDEVAVGAVAVQGPEIRMPDTRIGELGPLVISTARDVAATVPAGYPI